MKPSGAHTHPPSGSGLPAALAVIAVAAIAAVAGPVLDAVAALLHAVILIGAVTIAVAIAALVALAVYRAHRPRSGSAHSRWLAGRAGPPHLSAAPRRAALGQASPPVIHLHLRGTSPQDVAEVLARHFLTIDSQDGGDRHPTP